MDWTSNKSELQAKNLKEIVDFAGSLIQMALAVVAGTIAILLGSSYVRPVSLPIRITYFLFIPGWLCLGIAIYQGILIRQHYLAALLAFDVKIIQDVNRAAGEQLNALKTGFAIFAVWLGIYLSWWIFATFPVSKP